MKIGIDISQVVYGTGVSVYTRNLIKNILAMDETNDYTLFGGTARRKADLENFFSELNGSFNKKVVLFPPLLADFVWNRLHVLSPEFFIGKVDLFHSSDWSQPPGNYFKVTTVHDLAPIKYPEFTHPKNVSVHKARLAWVKKEVDRVIVPSKATKNDLIDFGVSPQKVRIIPEALDEKFILPSRKKAERLKGKYNIKGNYALAVGTSERKNLERIIKAFLMVKNKLGLTELIVIGEHTPQKDSSVRFLGYISQDEFPFFYAFAQVFIYPTLYEGFGLPVLEAFESGCPVVTSNSSSLVEVASDAAVLVDPKDLESIADGIISALKNRKNLTKKGKNEVKKYSWEHSARETIKVYQEAGNFSR